MSCVVEVVVSFLSLSKFKHASSLDIESIGVTFAVLLGLVQILKRLGDIVFQEVAPGKMLVYAPVVLLERKGGFITFLRVLIILLDLV